MSRPYTTHYYNSRDDAIADWASHGHSASEKGAVRAAVVRVFVNQYAYARVYHEGAAIFTIGFTRTGLKIGFGSALPTYSKAHL